MDIGKPDQQLPPIQNFVSGELASEKQRHVKRRELTPIGDTVISQTSESLTKKRILTPPQEAPQLSEPQSEANDTGFTDQILQFKEMLQLPGAKDLENQSRIANILTAIFGNTNPATRTSKSGVFQSKEQPAESSGQIISQEPGEIESNVPHSLHSELMPGGHITEFFDFLSKCYPIGLSMQASVIGNEEKLSNFESSSPVAEILKLLSPQLKQQTLVSGTAASPEESAAIWQTLSGFSEFETALPEQQQKILRFINDQTESPGILKNASAISQALSFLSPEEKLPTLALFSFFQSSSPKTGPDFAGEFIKKNISSISLRQEDAHKEKELVYSHAFKYASFAGTLLGLALIFSEKKEEDSKAALLFSAKLQAVHELKLLDLIPFSFLAFFPDIRQKKEEDSDVIKSAKNALLQLIRILLQLIFVLSALAIANQKLGSKEMAQILEKHSLFLLSLFDRLIFALKKVDELYVIDVDFHLRQAELAKRSLVSKEENLFWQASASLFSTKTELSSFLEESEEGEVLFKTIKNLLSEPEKLSFSSQAILS